MAKEHIYPAHVTPQVFQEFAWFDLLRMQKRYRLPAAFTLVMAAFAAVCFLMGDRVSHAKLLGCVLLGVGLVLPTGWLLSFYFSLRGEAKRLKLAQAPIAYTLKFTDQELTVSSGQEKAGFPWKSLHCVCRLHRCICLYAGPRRAFLLPTGTEQEGDKLWALLCQRMPGEKMRDYR